MVMFPDCNDPELMHETMMDTVRYKFFQDV